ncbi:site-specific integrase [Paraburkholderia sp. MM5384-R2]|uniref:site-specific integrase n=1 Tax=unclassified Paraburkholderia TaxID=2615204 RepID=UPI00160A9B66|nr:site-specific integrase [Paraburkholderia sp. MM5384-R2]MBB5501642.1 integrase [Paraburkholderia sp. MM5384-R2]
MPKNTRWKLTVAGDSDSFELPHRSVLSTMTYHVMYSDPSVTTRAGFGKVAGLPYILDSRPGYHRLGSRYLIDRGLGVWDPVKRGVGLPEALPSDQSMKDYADWLANFLEYADVRKIDLRTCDYITAIRDGYQKEQVEGTWSRDGQPLAPNSVNVRVDHACNFLLWMVDKGLRPKFDIPSVTVTVSSRKASNSRGHSETTKDVRAGRLRKDKRTLQMPTEQELRKWLDAVYRRNGYAKGLMCESVLLTAMRRTEISRFRVDGLPEDRRNWRTHSPDAPLRQQKVLISIRYGTKGPDYGKDHGDKIGPSRSIWVPVKLAQRWDEYRKAKHGRIAALKIWVSGARTKSERKERIDNAVHMFLDERTGLPITSKQLYHAWTNVELPYDGWSCHLGRDWWACATLIAYMKPYIPAGRVDAAQERKLEMAAVDVIRFVIQPQLGHADDETSMIYLRWFMNLIANNLWISYEDDLNSGSVGNGA